MNILQILLNKNKGGLASAFISQINALSEIKDHNVTVIAKKGSSYLDKVNRGIKIYELNNRFGYFDVFLISKIKKIIKEHEINIVIAHAGRAINLAYKAAVHNDKVKLAGFNHSYNFKRSLVCDIIFCVNSEIKNLINNAGRKKDVYVIPNMIELDNKKYQSKKRGKKFIIGGMGELNENKAFDLLINAAANLIIQDNIDIEIKIAGIGPEQENLIKLAKSLNIVKKIQFINWIEDKEKFFTNIDVFCLPSRSESFGNVIIEAMKYNCAVIASDCGGPKDIIENDKNGLLFKKDNIADLQNSIKKIYNDKKLQEHITNNAQKTLVKKYEKSLVIKNMIEKLQ